VPPAVKIIALFDVKFDISHISFCKVLGKSITLCYTKSMAEITSTAKLKPEDKPSKEQLRRIDRAAEMPVVSDKDSPVYTFEQLSCLYLEAKKHSIYLKDTGSLFTDKKQLKKIRKQGRM
jgi:hypothetical protein